MNVKVKNMNSLKHSDTTSTRMEKSRIIYYIILLSFIAYIFYPRDNCEKFKQEYKDIALDMQIQKISKPQNHMKTEGFDTKMSYIRWEDRGTLFLNNHEKLIIGRRIVKVKGDSLFRIYRNDSIISTFYYECGR